MRVTRVAARDMQNTSKETLLEKYGKRPDTHIWNRNTHIYMEKDLMNRFCGRGWYVKHFKRDLCTYMKRDMYIYIYIRPDEKISQEGDTRVRALSPLASPSKTSVSSTATFDSQVCSCIMYTYIYIHRYTCLSMCIIFIHINMYIPYICIHCICPCRYTW